MHKYAMLEIDYSTKNVKVQTYPIEHVRPTILKTSEINYNDFFNNFMSKNVPCVIKNVSDSWECTIKWIQNEEINFEYLIHSYGMLQAPVADCDDITNNAQNKTDMKFSDYASYFKCNVKKKLLYLKDWHLKRLCPEDSFYKVPIIFASDWLNEYALDHKEDDFMFVYIGPEKSWTPLHVDVYHSYSWSVNVVGRKKWILFPPGEEIKLKDPVGNLPIIFKPENFDGIKYFEVIQEKGDALFVPSGWHHQVLNQLDTISVNHNWINACNIEAVWEALKKCLIDVENEIKEFKDTPEFPFQCQLILKSLFGMDFSDFIKFLCYIAEKRSKQIQQDNRIIFSEFELGINHILFDLKTIFHVMNLIQNHPLFLIKYFPLNIVSSFMNTLCTLSKLIVD